MFKDLLGDIFPIIEKAAPILATALGSPIAGSASVIALNLLASAFGININDANKLSTAIYADPDAAIKLKEVEEKYASFNLKIDEEDTANARDREEKIIKLTGKEDYILHFIALVIIIGFFVFSFLNYFIKVPDDHVVTLLIGQLSAGFLMVLGYYFGATKPKKFTQNN